MPSRCLCAKVFQQYFPEFKFLRPRDMQKYIFMFSIVLEWLVNLICDRQIFKYNTVIS
jgi:hypothetical protein